MEILEKVQLVITSSAFRHGKKIPAKYSCDGDNINPPLNIGKVPKETESLALIMSDPDAPAGEFIHWIVWNISPFEPVEENSKPGIEGRNSAGETGYYGPCPPSGSHHYIFTVYALDAELHLVEGSSVDQLMNDMKDHIIGSGSITGIYQRKKK